MVENITIKLNFLTNHNKTNIRVLRIYNSKNSTQYNIIIYIWLKIHLSDLSKIMLANGADNSAVHSF